MYILLIGDLLNLIVLNMLKKKVVNFWLHALLLVFIGCRFCQLQDLFEQVLMSLAVSLQFLMKQLANFWLVI